MASLATAVRKPKKPRRVTIPKGWMAPQTYKRISSAYKSTTPAAPPAPKQLSPPSLTPVPSQSSITRPTGPPPATVQGQNARDAAMENFRIAIPDINRQIMQAALRYGGVGNAVQFGMDDTQSQGSVLQNDPNSAVAVIARNLEASKNHSINQHSSGNTFWSGFHESAQQEHQNEASRNRAQALNDYNNAVADLMSAWAQSRAQRDQGIREGNALDLEYAMSLAPEPMADQPPAADPAPSAPTSAPAESFKTVYGADSKGNPGEWHIYPPSLRYPQGRKVFVRK